jgi:hypothetical protein
VTHGVVQVPREAGTLGVDGVLPVSASSSARLCAARRDETP